MFNKERRFPKDLVESLDLLPRCTSSGYARSVSERLTTHAGLLINRKIRQFSFAISEFVFISFNKSSLLSSGFSFGLNSILPAPLFKPSNKSIFFKSSRVTVIYSSSPSNKRFCTESGKAAISASVIFFISTIVKSS